MAKYLRRLTTRISFRISFFPRLYYIHDLWQGLNFDIKLFVDDTSLFSVIQNVDPSFPTLNNDLVKIQGWTYNWKMSFNPDRNKQAQEVVFFRKTEKKIRSNLYFIGFSIEKSVAYNHLGTTLSEKQLHQW